MIKSFSGFITNYLGKNNSSLTKTDLLKIDYTLQVVLGDLTKFTIILLLFIYLKQLPLFLLSFVVLNTIRPLAGGLHCKTFMGCLAVSTIYFISVIVFSIFCPKLSSYCYMFFFMAFFVIFFKYAPCPNEKRPIKNKEKLKFLSLVSLTFWTILFFTLSNIQISNCIFMSLTFLVIQLIIFNIKGVVYNAKIYKHFFSRIT